LLVLGKIVVWAGLVGIVSGMDGVWDLALESDRIARKLK
jgi:hypothetical protein